MILPVTITDGDRVVVMVSDSHYYGHIGTAITQDHARKLGVRVRLDGGQILCFGTDELSPAGRV